MTGLRELATDQTFWAVLATANTALLIAVVLEGRTAREDADRRAIEAARAFENHWATWSREWQLHQDAHGPDPGPPPGLVRPLPSDSERRGWSRVGALLVALWLLALAAVGSVVVASPAGYIGDVLAGIGMSTTLLFSLLGLCALVWAATRPIQLG